MSQKNVSQETNSYAAVIAGVVVMLGFCLVLLGVLGNRTHVPYTSPNQVAVQPAPTLITQLPKRNVVTYASNAVASGKQVFTSVCAACHGLDAKGITGLGKNLIESDFVHGLKDDELVAFIVVGRPIYDAANTTGVAMPARGGDPSISDATLYNVVAYIRTLTDPSLIDNSGGGVEVAAVQPTPTLSGPLPTSAPFVPLNFNAIGQSDATSTEEAVATTEPTAAPTLEPTVEPTVSTTTTDTTGAASTVGQETYAFSCSGCHGTDGNGIEGIPNSGLFAEPLDRQTLLDFITNGNQSTDIYTYFHPAGGTYPALETDKIAALTDYILSLAPGGTAETGEAPAATEAVVPETGAADTTGFDAAGTYNFACSGCHAANGTGVSGLAQSLLFNQKVISRDTGSLLTFLITGDAMHLPRGGYPELNDDQLRALIDYLYKLTSGM